MSGKSAAAQGVGRRPLGRVLVTGAAGFLGRAVLDALGAAGVETAASDIVADGRAVRRCDVTELDAVDALLGETPVDTILHCGAVSGPMVMADRPDMIWRINTLGAANVLEAARRRGVGRVVLCSTTDVYGSAPRGMLDETASLAPDTVYGASKAAAEQAVLGWRREHGLDGVIVRLSWIYGPGRNTPTRLERLIRDALAGRDAVVEGRPEDMTHYIHIDDAMRGLLAAAAAPRSEPCVFNVTAGRGRRLRDVVEAARTATGAGDMSFSGEPDAAGPAGFEIRRAETALGFRATVTLEDGMRRWAAVLSATGG